MLNLIKINTAVQKPRIVTLCLQKVTHRENFVKWWLFEISTEIVESSFRERESSFRERKMSNVVLGLRSSSGRKRVAVAPSVTGTKLKVGISYVSKVSQLRHDHWAIISHYSIGNYVLCHVITVETAYKVYICPRGNLLYMRIYLITDLKLL